MRLSCPVIASEAKQSKAAEIQPPIPNYPVAAPNAQHPPNSKAKENNPVNKYRPEENALLIWNPTQARTAYISGPELNALENWLTGQSSGFITRLENLGLISLSHKPAITKAITQCKSTKSPTNSFSAPESLHIELTSHCPLNCPQCYKHTQSHPSTHQDPNFLSYVIKQAAEMQVFQIALGGGEPLTYPHLNHIVQEIHQQNMASSITTSGHGLNQHALNNLITQGLNHIQISLNGSTAAIHSHSRDGFNHAINALSLLQNAPISYGVNWVARRDNIQDFPQFIAKMKSYNAGNINILRYKPSKNENYPDICLSQEDLSFLAKTIKSTRGIRLKTDSAFAGLLCHLNQRISFMSGCGAARRFLALDSQGNYRPCSHVPIKEKSDSLHQLWHSSKNLHMFRTIGNKIGQPCANCSYLTGCYGCRAVVLGQGGEFFDGDITCTFF